MSTDSMASGWYYSRRGAAAATGVAPAAQQAGPFTWEELYAHAQAGGFGPDDLVWNAQLPDWLPAAQIPGLFPTAAPAVATSPIATAQSPAYQPAAYQPPAQGPYPPGAYRPGPRPGAQQPATSRRSNLLTILIPLIAVIVVAGGLGAYFGLLRGSNDNGTGGNNTGSTVSSQTTSTAASQSADVGTIEVTVPDRTKLAETTKWGEVPVNQIGVILADGKTRADADQIAQTLGGTVVGELEFLNAYQIRTAGTAEADLQTALDQATATAGVELAFPNQEVYTQEEIWGVRKSPLNDPAYSGNCGKGYELIGAQKAWNYIKGAGLPLSGVKVGIVDEGLSKGTGEFSGPTKIEYPDPEAGELADPAQLENAAGGTVADPRGSHGTMVAGIIGADPTNGGQTGIASTALGDKLTLSVINVFAGQYGQNSEVAPDPDDPTQVTLEDGKSYMMGSLAAILKQVKNGATVINCSFAPPKLDPNNALAAAAYTKFFQKMSQDYPKVTFVCAAGNEDGELSKTNCFPAGAGSGLPNVITVGNVMNEGQKADSSNHAGPDGEITLSAPGEEAVQGVDASGKPITDTYRRIPVWRWHQRRCPAGLGGGRPPPLAQSQAHPRPHQGDTSSDRAARAGQPGCRHPGDRRGCVGGDPRAETRHHQGAARKPGGHRRGGDHH